MKLAVELWCAVVVAEFIALVARYSMVHDEAQKMLDTMAKDGNAEGLPSAQVLAIISLAIGAVVLTALSVTFMKFTWDGRNWARQGLGVLSAFIAVQLVFTVIVMFSGAEPTGASVPAWATIFEILGGVAAIGALIALMNRDTTIFCRDAGLWRTRNRQNGGMR
ncbi:hypothetical protein GCM10023197_18600 [Gordonia humi]|uniref:hypothetical protein n=1 Tax=Gordonia humi TaxID=686429 RepID=UPI003387A7C0